MTTQSLIMSETSKLAEMIMVMKEVMKDKEVQESFTAQFRDDCKRMIEESKNEIKKEVEEIIEEKMKPVEVKNTAMEERMNAMEKWADSAEQESRSTNLIIRGLTNINGLNEQELVTNIATTLSRKLEMKLTPEDIKYAIKIGKNVNDNHKPVKVVFHDWRAGDFIFRKEVSHTHGCKGLIC